ncbi:CPBP family intramembrane metalloprotease [candidate division WOR-3 bacterium]|nr:CPBP family intramembrane metalloprotease [candidate division WOR-3 bacterium]
MKKKYSDFLKNTLFVSISIFSLSFFVWSLPRFFPIADMTIPSGEIESAARNHMRSCGYDLSSHECQAVLKCDEDALSYTESALGTETTQGLIRNGTKIYYYDLYFKKPGNSEFFVVSCHPDSGVISWKRILHDDLPGDSLTENEAVEIAVKFIPSEGWTQKGINRTVLINRTDYEIIFERYLFPDDNCREIAVFSMAGRDISGFQRRLYVPSSFSDSLKTVQSKGESLTILGYIAMSAGGIFAFITLIRKMNGAGNFVPVFSPVIILVSLCWLATILLESPIIFASWDPLWPKFLFSVRWTVFEVIGQIQILVLFISILFAGHILAVSENSRKEETFKKIFSKNILSADASRSLLKGVFIGMISGGIYAFLCLGFKAFFPSSYDIQPRGFYLYILNSRIPALSSALYFLLIAIIEEAGYRHFGTMLTKKMFKNTFAAVLATSLVYGLTHSTLNFLPPAEPFWGRALVMTCIGVFWSVVYLKTDLLTVVSAHYLCDLFIFNLPLIANSPPSNQFLTFLCIFWILLIPVTSFISGRCFKTGGFLRS